LGECANPENENFKAKIKLLVNTKIAVWECLNIILRFWEEREV